MSLARALTGNQDGQVTLEDAESRDLFLRRLDDEGEWFRYHHLFAEFLHRRLERDDPLAWSISIGEQANGSATGTFSAR